jgi:hypothetical protein
MQVADIRAGREQHHRDERHQGQQRTFVLVAQPGNPLAHRQRIGFVRSDSTLRSISRAA